MTTTHTAKGIVWIDLQSPSDEDISSLVNRYGLHPLVGEELKDTQSVAKIDFHSDYVLVVLTFPMRLKVNGVYSVVDREVDFVIGKNFLITSHKDAIEQLEYFGKVFETNAILNKDSKIDNTSQLFYYMVMRLYAGMCEDLENVRDTLKHAENCVFQGEERKMVSVLSKISRELIDFRETVRIHRDVWEDMISFSGRSVFSEDFKPYMHDIKDEFVRIHEIVQNSRELVSELRETNDSLLNTKQNDIIRTLTIVTFVFSPAIFIASLFTIPAKIVPLIENDGGWLTISGLMVIITIVILLLLKRKKWL